MLGICSRFLSFKMMAPELLCYKMSSTEPTLLGHNHGSPMSLESRVLQAGLKTTKIAASPMRQKSYILHCISKNHQSAPLKGYLTSPLRCTGTSGSNEGRQTLLESYLSKTRSKAEDFDESCSQHESPNVSQRASFVRLGRKRTRDLRNKSQVSPLKDESPDFYLVSILASIDIAVFLFEVASPIKNSDYNLFSLPLLYGAKVNDLILAGEWWRLLTPMFLHSGVFHVALSCWVLLDFGPRVCKGYGSFTFFLVCLLGGISGNLMSFLHTPEPAVGGSGPVFAIIGAWLIYQLQNKDVISKEVSDPMYRKATIATALSLGLANFGLIDNWACLGAALTGITNGFLTSPILQLDDPLSKTTREEGIALVRHHASPWKSLAVFTFLVAVLSSLVYLIDAPLETPELEDLLVIME